MEHSWVFPKRNFIKINTHAVHFPNPLSNGNTSGVGVVIRDHKGTIILMVSGSIRGVTARANELWALLIGLRCAFYEQEYKIQIETDNEEAAREWRDWRWFIDPNHAGIIQQLLQRASDPNLSLDEVEVITDNQNRLARFLAEDGAHARTRLVAYRRPFARVRELWRLDMGLGPVDGRFMVMDEDEYDEFVGDGEEVEGLGDLLLADVGSPSMGADNNPANNDG